MEKTIKCLLLKNESVILIAEIIEVGSELGEPDCKLVHPFRMNESNGEIYLEPWLSFTTESEFMIHSDSILTLVDPTPDIIEKYEEVLK